MEIKTEVKDCSECPHQSDVRHYTADSFEMVFKWTCTKANKHIAYVDATDKNPKIPEWCPAL